MRFSSGFGLEGSFGSPRSVLTIQCRVLSSPVTDPATLTQKARYAAIPRNAKASLVITSRCLSARTSQMMAPIERTSATAEIILAMDIKASELMPDRMYHTAFLLSVRSEEHTSELQSP